MMIDVLLFFMLLFIIIYDYVYDYVAATLALKASSDGASAVVAGRLFHSRAVLGNNEWHWHRHGYILSLYAVTTPLVMTAF